MERIFVTGAGGQGRVVLDTVKNAGEVKEEKSS